MGWDNLDLSQGISTEVVTFQGRNGGIPAEVYRPEGNRLRPAVVFLHGGGFFGGSIKTVANPCRRLAQKADAVVVSVDYRLAPEFPFPAGLHDAYDAVLAVKKQGERWGIDRSRIVVAGDSAGGNLAAGCCLLDRKQVNPIVAAQLLVYPVVDLRKGDNACPWSEQAYDVQSAGEWIWPAILWAKNNRGSLDRNYLNGHPDDDPLVSPLADPRPQDFPPTLVITAEYDYLRVQGEAFAESLAQAGVLVRAVRFQGMDHAFLDKLGLFPQAALAVDEMAGFLRGEILQRVL